MKKLAVTIFLMVLGFILAGYAILAPMLKIIGTRTTGFVTDVRRQGGERNEMTRNQYNYGVGFYFILPNGKRIEGGATVVGSSYSAGVPKGPVSILYLKSFPRIHILEEFARFSIGNVILIGTGLLLIYFSLKGDKTRK
ncbi:MAG: hypothetical protein FP816_17335 [Desulfobacteraceae bacterium]|nr:hypothetical protein [Desulfobacteraceae bacterium]MBU4001721.1 hypothetical protein [Pseudomonadota bacterium]MBU4055385.1 hypothetical protein [Pseudomonadota bacterium]